MIGGVASAATSTGKLETRIVRVALKDLRVLEGHENARYMKAPQFKRLVENLVRDGVLTSTPLIYKGVVRSGNHRVQAAIKAGIVDAECIELLGEYPEDRVLAIQLAHNAINGEDDPNILAKIWKPLSFDEKRYSGLTDEIVGAVKPIDVKSLGLGGPQQEEITLLFLPEEAKTFVDLVARIEKKVRRPPVFAASRADFDKFFDTIVAVKTALNIHNTALAIGMMAQLANERLEQMVPDTESDEPQTRAH